MYRFVYATRWQCSVSGCKRCQIVNRGNVQADAPDVPGDAHHVDGSNLHAGTQRRAATSVRTLRLNARAHRHVDRKSTRLNSSHVAISYAVFCLKKKTMRKYTRDLM